jgi:hypothetical protein
MITKIKYALILTVLLLNAFACENAPKVIKSSTDASDSKESTGVFSDAPSTPSNMNTLGAFNDDLHTVKVNEVLETSKYLYLNVTENEEQFWIATRIMDIVVGETYYYKGGLLKTNYESKDFNRVFEKIYLISSHLVSANHSAITDTTEENNLKTKQETTKPTVNAVKTISKKIEVKGSMKISELVKNPKKFEGKTIQISGVCVKVNANIMNKNWIHLKDGSQDDYDLVITSDTFIEEGSIITLKATVTLNKDYGAGYKYDLILENGTILN